jgi:hypothetical protein
VRCTAVLHPRGRRELSLTLLEVIKGEVKHQDREEQEVDLSNGQARQCEVEEIEGEEESGEEPGQGAFEEPLTEDEDEGNHRGGGNDAEDPPAEGAHAEARNTCGDDELPQRRMRPFIGLLEVEVLFRSAAKYISSK